MKTVFKYQIPVSGLPHRVIMPSGAVALYVDVQQQPDVVMLWAEVPRRHFDYSERTFQVFGTAAPIPDKWKYIGTAILPTESLVWHLYEQKD